MDKNYLIFTDISADIDPAFAEEHQIHFLPMNYSVGGEDRCCSAPETDEFLKVFYDGQRNGDLTQTTQISPQSYIDLFRPYLEAGNSILYLSLSSGLSNTYASSLMAVRELGELYPEVTVRSVDSLSATGGMDMLLEFAVRNRENGMSLEENARWLEENRLRVCHWFMVDDLMYLKRGGRVSAASAVMGTALDIKPILKINREGKLDTFMKKRGAKNAMKELLALYEGATEGGENELIYIIHSDVPDRAEFVANALREKNPSCRIKTRMLSPIIGAHTGPGLCAIVHMGNR